MSTLTGLPPTISAHFHSRKPSDIRIASILFSQRTDGTRALNVAIGNVSLPMHPRMQERLRQLGQPGDLFERGTVGYTATVGTDAARAAVLHILKASGLPTDGLHVQITDGGSQAMELVILGVCGPAGTGERPLLLLDAAYTNYGAFASRLGRTTCSIQRTLQADGRFTLPSEEAIEEVIRAHNPGALVVIPYDNPTGHYCNLEALQGLARLCVKHGLWLIGDEAYRELHYTGEVPSSIWALTEAEVPGITGRRIGIETASKVWNGCGLRIGALVTDSAELHQRAVAENTASLCSSTLGQHIFAALSEESIEDLQHWFQQQRAYYHAMLAPFASTMRTLLPGVIVGNPDASLYAVIDVRDVAAPGFDANEFVNYCATRGRVELEDGPWTLLTAPMKGFYSVPAGHENPGRTQVRVAFVEPPQAMARVPELFTALFTRFEHERAATSATS